MRKNVKRSLAFALAMFLFVTAVSNQELFVLAEDEAETIHVTEAEREDEATSEEVMEDSLIEETFEKDSETSTEIIMDSIEVEGDVQEPQIPEESEIPLETDDNMNEEIEINDICIYQPEIQPEGVSVVAYASKGVFPEGTTISVIELSTDDETLEQYKKTEEVLSASEVEYDGFIAFDISFYDIDGNVIEPEDGTVQVQIELDTSWLPKSVDMATLEVQHLDESYQDIEVVTVADTENLTDGTVEMQNEEVIAVDFSVDSFSTIAVTYNLTRTSVGQVYGAASGINLHLFDYDDTNASEGGDADDINHSLENHGLDDYIRWVGSLDYETKYDYPYSEGFIQGMVGNRLVNNYPVLLKEHHDQNNPVGSLDFLFSAGDSNVTYHPITSGGLFQLEDGYYVYNSDRWAADYIDGQMIVRDYVERGKSTADRSLASTDVGYSDFLPFNHTTKDNTTGEGKSLGTAEGSTPYQYEIKDVNYWFSMKLDANFEQPKDGIVNGNQDMIFDFTGDDDVWLFIDGVLVLDMGGTHAASSGSINFKTGEITYTSYNIANNEGIESDGTKGTGWDENLQKITIKECFKEALGDSFDESLFKGNTFADYTTHRIDYFYVERGSGSSCCRIKFNIPTIPTETVEVKKTVEGLNENLASKQNYSMKLFVQTKVGVENYKEYIGGYVLRNMDGTISNEQTASDGMITLKNGQTALFDVQQGRKYYVVEYDTIDYDVSFKHNDGVATPGTILAGTQDDIQSEKYTIVNGSDNKVEVINAVKDYELEVTKKFSGAGLSEAIGPDGFEATFNLYKADDIIASAKYSEFVDNKYTFSNLLPGEYVVIESEPTHKSGQNLVHVGTVYTPENTSSNGAKASVTTAGEPAKVSVENQYQYLTKELTVTKTVTGSMGDRNKAFDFELSIKDNSNGIYSEPLSCNTGNTRSLTAENGVYAFNLKNGDSITITIPYGYSYEINEVINPNEGYTTTIEYAADTETANPEIVKKEGTTCSGVLTTNAKADYTNHKDAIAPMGIHHNTTPFIIMLVTAAVMAACWFVVLMNNKKRRMRRRR